MYIHMYMWPSLVAQLVERRICAIYGSAERVHRI